MGYFIFAIACFLSYAIGQAVGLTKAQIKAKEYVGARKYALYKSHNTDSYTSGFERGMEAVVHDLYGYKVTWEQDYGK